jgi:hypothetical protein
MHRLRIILACHFVAILLASPVLAQQSDNPPVRVTISKETTWITEPLREDGYPDYLRYLNQKMSAGVTPANNAAVLLWQAMGPSEIDKEHRNLFFKELGVDPPPESGSYFVDWETYHASLPRAKRPQTSEANVDPDEVWKRHERAQEEPWTSQSDPELAAWLKANEKSIDLFVRASHRSRYYSPLIAGGEPFLAFNLSQINPVRKAAATLAARAMLRLGEGQAKAAWAVASEKLSFVFAALMLPALISTAQAEDRGATYFTLVELAVSLERFRVDHGRYPNAIVELAPKYVSEIPRDAFADRPLQYKNTKMGYLLYSFGKNGHDDGGITHNDVNEADDIVVATPRYRNAAQI